MGILNITPDSFSDGGEFVHIDAAIAQAERLHDEGASIIDVGGESTRPGADAVSVDEQIARVVPVVSQLRARFDKQLDISIDARRTDVAKAALEAGASMINDVSAGADKGMFELAAANNVPIVLMHMRGTPASMQEAPHYDDVVKEVADYLQLRAKRARDAGVPVENIIVDPGVGFGKTKQHNLTILANLNQFVALGYTVMLGTSRKRFMGAICQETAFKELVGATCATTALGTLAGIGIFRVHDVRENRQAMEVALATMDY